MSKLTRNESALLNIIAHQNDAMKYLRKALDDVVPQLAEDGDYYKFTQIQEQSDQKIKDFLKQLQNYEG